MWRIVWFFWGWYRIRITGASPQWILGALAKGRVAFRDFQKIDEFTAELVIVKRDLPKLKRAAQKAMCDDTVVAEGGFRTAAVGLKKRPLLPVLILFSALAASILTRFVWFYDVSGNTRVPSQMILRELKELGVGVGTFGPSIKPQELKNEMLCRIPDLQWLTVVQNGAFATVIVRERPELEPIMDRKTPRNVVAARGGILTRVSVLEGNSLCKEGDVVEEGQLLVSAYSDWGFKTQVSSALAEIYAITAHRSCAAVPAMQEKKSDFANTDTQISLLIGQKRVNIFGNSGIPQHKCDKMTVYHRLTLPAGYILPVTIEVTSKTDYNTVMCRTDPAAARQDMEQTLLHNTRRDMIAGTVLDASFTLKEQRGALRLYASMQCDEMIARMVNAEIFKDDLNAND